MKPTSQLAKCGPSNAKSKKNSKDREKRKPPGIISDVNNHSSSEKGSPTKDSNTRLYAGIDSDSLTIYAEQTGIEHLSDEIANTLTEDINYRLRYVINDCLIKARLSGRNAISSQDLEHTFENLKIDKVYGAPSYPNWVPFGYQNLYYLDDKIVNLPELAQEINIYHQYSESVVTKKWIPEQKDNTVLKNYFVAMCQLIVSNEEEMRKLALKNVSENSKIGTIIEWFYNFGYILLSKDITYDCLTRRALDLITVLEQSRMCRINVSEKQLKLLVRLILQRLLKSATTEEILKAICKVLAILCERVPLKEFVLLKVQQKLSEVFFNYDLAVLTVVNSLGADGVKSILLPNLQMFLNRALEKRESSFSYSLLESYYILFKEHLVDLSLYNAFYDCFGENLVAFSAWKGSQKRDNSSKNFAHVKCALVRTRRRIAWSRKESNRLNIEEVFEMPSENSKLRKKIDSITWDNGVKQTSVVVGRTTLLLPIFQKKPSVTKCCNHTLWYQL